MWMPKISKFKHAGHVVMSEVERGSKSITDWIPYENERGGRDQNFAGVMR